MVSNYPPDGKAPVAHPVPVSRTVLVVMRATAIYSLQIHWLTMKF